MTLRPLSAPRFVAPKVPTSDKKGKKRQIIDVDGPDDAPTDADVRLWADRYAAEDVSELCVHKRKVEDVRKWLKEALFEQAAFRFRRMLVLSGPAGSGKTATLRALSQELDFDIVEYRSPDPGTEGLTSHFTSFLARAGVASRLAFQSEASTLVKAEAAASSKPKIVLVEDLPNVFTSIETRDSFRAAITAYASAPRASSAGTPLVVVVSEALVRSSAENEFAALAEGPSWQDNVTARTLIPQDLLLQGRATEIKFNPVAPTLLKKALQRVFDTAMATQSKHILPEVLDMLVQSSNGDIRCALNNAQMLATQGSGAKALFATSKPKAKKKKGVIEGAASSAVLPMLSSRETSLFLFHAVGKVLYSKRAQKRLLTRPPRSSNKTGWGEDEDDDAKDKRTRPPKQPKLPKYLRAFARAESKVDVETLRTEMPVDSDMFISYIHQNFPAFVDTPEQVEEVCESFSDADCLLGSMAGSVRHPLAASYAFQTAVRGTMFALPCPVPRRGQKLLKSVYWDHSRNTRDNASDLVALRLALMRRGYDCSSSATSFVTERLAYMEELAPIRGFDLPMGAQKAMRELCTFTSAPGKDVAMDEGEIQVDETNENEVAGAIFNDRDDAHADASDDEDVLDPIDD